MLKLSIITINYNNAEGLEKTIESVVNQTFHDYEFIIIDGNSTDNSKQIIEKYDPKITTWISELDTGIYNAMNKGISKAKGEYCLFLNSGDYLHNQSILEFIFQKKHSADIVYGDMLTINDKGIQKHLKMPYYVGSRRLFFDTIWHPVSFIRRDLFLKYGYYDESYKIVSDYEFFVRVIIGKHVSLKKVPYIITVFDTKGLSSDKMKVPQILLERAKAQENYFNPYILWMYKFYYKIRYKI
jgi:glycosyltransferase involved in cell wall biosynthesis